ncbi:MAG: hypothetical protein ACTHNZ_24015 [Trinickia sp.]|uniref:hypothetical protein n=1 Tax=Trinickia sp. TaxID=2571163 RepID=UPI003F81F516
MKRILIDGALAALLTLPVYIGLANTPIINDWFLYGRGWATFHPLFVLGHAIGITRNAAIVIGTMFVISFVLSVIAVALTRRAVRSVLT